METDYSCNASVYYTDNFYYEKLIVEDGIHPNDAGHELIAKELIQYLNETDSE